MIGEVPHPSNMMRACRQVVANKGSAGAGGTGVDGLYGHSSANRKKIGKSLRDGFYLPQPVLGVGIPKADGKKRQPGIPVVPGRMLQQAVSQVLCNHYGGEFPDYSYGFRPNRNARQAVMRPLEYINGGNGYIVDMDLKNFFGGVNHCLLLQIPYRKVKCRQALRLIRIQKGEKIAHVRAQFSLYAGNRIYLYLSA